MFLLVIVRPNSAFATIRDNADRYFWWSVIVFGLSYVVFTICGHLVYSELSYLGMSPPIMTVTYIILYVLGFVTLVYIIGKVWGGNQCWKKVFTVMFYKNVALILVFTIMTIIWYFSRVIETPLSDSLSQFFLLESTIILVIGIFGFAIWANIMTIKAIKVVHEFSTIKAILVGLCSLIPIIVMGIIYNSTLTG